MLMFRPNNSALQPAYSIPSSDWPDHSKRPIHAWLASIVFHTVILILIGIATDRTLSGLADDRDGLRDASGDDSGVDKEREISVTLIHRITHREPAAENADSAATTTATQSGAQSATQSDQSPGGSGDASDVSATAPTASRSMPPGFTPPINLDGVLSELLAAPEPAANAAVTTGGGLGRGGLGELGNDSGDGQNAKAGDRGLQAAGGGASSAASLFGVTGTGSRIVYVIDRSDSMNGGGGRPLLAAKNELIRSLDALKQSQFFQFILYNEEPRPYRGADSAGNAVQMIQAEKPAIKRAQAYIESIAAFGGTNHVDALRIALRMRPDVIFFLTDGLLPSLSERELSDIARIADSYGTTIHGIEFGTQPTPDPSSFVPRLAAASRGQYRYFDVTRFSSTGQWHLNPDP